MRLLPDEKRPDGRRRFRAAGTGHFRPARAGVALLLRRGFGARQNFLVIAEAFFQQRQPVPQREVRLVPPVHFQMKFALPGVVRQPGFRRRIFSGVLDGGEILRQHDAPFEFKPARVLAAGQINRAAGRPELVPIFLRRRVLFPRTSARLFAGRFVWRKGADKFQHVRLIFLRGGEHYAHSMVFDQRRSECCPRRPFARIQADSSCAALRQVCARRPFCRCNNHRCPACGETPQCRVWPAMKIVSCASGLLQSAVIVSPVP